MNLLSKYLSKINVAYTKRHLRELLEQYPYKDSLWMYHKILDEYGVPYVPYRVRSKDLIEKIQVPFLAKVKTDIVIVDNVTDEAVSYESPIKRDKKPLADFLDDWTGVVLEGIPNEESQEEGYAQHVKEGRKEKMFLTLFCVCLACSLAFTSYVIRSYTCWGVYFLLAFLANLAGLLFSLLLLCKKHRLHSHIADKLCGIMPKGQCGKNSTAENIRILGMFDLSECGTGYFLANSIVLLFNADLFVYSLPYMAICTLPVIIWSVSYQWRKAQWCPLCLFTMAILLMQIIIYFLAGFFVGITAYSKSELFSFFVLALVYYSFVYLVHKGLIMFVKWQKLKQERESFLRMKSDETVFMAKLHKQRCFSVNDEAFSIKYGEDSCEKPVITVVGNPYCNPCALVHKRLGKLLQLGFQVQYVFTFFEEKLSFINKEILASFFKNGPEISWGLLSEWFENGRHTELHFDMQLTETDLQDKRISLFYEKQKEWIERNGVQATPLILINGYTMPSEYRIEDLYHIY